MYKILSFILLILLLRSGYSQDLPLGYIQYFNAQSKEKIAEQFHLSESAELVKSGGVFNLSHRFDTAVFEFNPSPVIIADSIVADSNAIDSVLNDTSDTIDKSILLSRRELPKAKIMVDNIVFGDFICQLELKISGSESDSLSGPYFITGHRDEDNFYFIHFGTDGTGLYSRYKGKVKRVAFDKNFILSEDQWHSVTITRNILKRSISIQNDGKQTNFSDPNLIMGQIGIGVNDNTLFFRKFVVSAPTAIVNGEVD